MIEFYKAQLSALIATAVDFTITILLVESLKICYLIATTFGAFGGVMINFIINKHWSFKDNGEGFKAQGIKYLLVWIGSICLNVYGSNLLFKLNTTSYIYSKIIVSIIVGITFNYTFQKYYVFKISKKNI